MKSKVGLRSIDGWKLFGLFFIGMLAPAAFCHRCEEAAVKSPVIALLSKTGGLSRILARFPLLRGDGRIRRLIGWGIGLDSLQLF